MSILVVLIASLGVFAPQSFAQAVVQDFDGNDAQFTQQKKPTGYTGGGTATCQVIGVVERRPTFQCKDPKTGKTQKVQCKKSPKQKLPDKITLAELDEACSLRSDNRF